MKEKDKAAKQEEKAKKKAAREEKRRQKREARLRSHIVTCPHCGKDVLDHMTRCPHCEGELTPTNYRSMSPEQRNAVKKVTYAVGAVVAVAVIVIIFVFLK